MHLLGSLALILIVGLVAGKVVALLRLPDLLGMLLLGLGGGSIAQGLQVKTA